MTTFTVKELADLAGVSVRTLHYYDQIGLLKPTRNTTNDYRLYDDEAVIRLQQILFFREMDFELAQILAIMDAPDYDVLQALKDQKKLLPHLSVTALIHT